MALFSWLGDLVAQLLYQEGIVAPQRRKWNLRGNGWDVRDDSVNERLDIYIDGEAVIQQDAPETLLVIGDDLAADTDFLRELRRCIDENQGNVSLVGDLQSSDGNHSALAASDLATVEARVTAMTITEPAAIIILAGREDVDNGDSASTIAAALTSLMVAIRAKWARARVIMADPTRWYSPAASFAAKTTVVEALYALMPIVADLPRTTYVPSGSLIDEDRIDATGALPNTKGYALLATTLAVALQNAIPPIYGRKDSRAFTRRVNQPLKAHNVERDLNRSLSMTDPATGMGDLTVAFWFYPDSMLTTEHRIMACTSSFFLFSDDRDLILRSGNGSAADLLASDVLTHKQWHRIAIVLEDTLMRFYVNGRLRGLEVAPPDGGGKHTWNVTSAIIIGGSVPGAVGWFVDVAMSDVAMSNQEAQDDYRDASGVPRNVIARYLLADLTDEMGFGSVVNSGFNLSDDGPLLPGEQSPVDTYSPETDADTSQFWRADMGLIRSALFPQRWANQTSVANSSFDKNTGGFPDVLRGEGSMFNGHEALSFASSGSGVAASVNRFLDSPDAAVFDFMADHGWAICIALLKHSPTSTDFEVFMSNKLATTDLSLGFKLITVEAGTDVLASVNIGNGATASIASGTVTQAMRVGTTELVSFRYALNAGANHARLETMLGSTEVNEDNAPTAGGTNLHLGADAAALTTNNFRGQVAEMVIFQNATAATLDASVAAWRTYAEERYKVRA